MASRMDLTAYPVFGACRSDAIAAEATADHFDLPNSSLWICSYGLPEVLDFSAGDFVHVHFSRDFRRAVWRVPRQVLVQKLAMLTGHPVASDLSFESAFNLESPQSGLALRLLESLLLAAETASDIVIAALEHALIAAFLDASQHAFRDQAGIKSRGAAPWQVHRAESYIVQNWERQITIEDLAAEIGASPRSIFRAFQQSRGYTPLEFAKQVRLKHARRLLESHDCPSVTEVAFACGFSDLSRFSKDFAQAFGERPSAVLNRKRSEVKAAS